MGGWLPCFKCNNYYHTHNGGAYINDESYCEDCACEIEAHFEMREEE